MADEPQLSTIYVGNIDYRMPIQEIELLFAQCGVLEDVYLPEPEEPEDESRVNRGYAFVRFSSPSAAKAAIEQFNDTRDPKFHRKLVVQKAKPRPAK